MNVCEMLRTVPDTREMLVLALLLLGLVFTALSVKLATAQHLHFVIFQTPIIFLKGPERQ